MIVIYEKHLQGIAPCRCFFIEVKTLIIKNLILKTAFKIINNINFERKIAFLFLNYCFFYFILRKL